MRLAFAALAAAALAFPAAAEDVPDLSGFWNAPIDSFDMPADLQAKLPPNTVVIDDTGAAEFPRGVFGGLKLTPEAAAHAETWTATSDMTLTRACLPPSIVYSVQGPFPFEIVQAPGLLVFRYEYYDQVRLIHTDGRDHPPADAPHSKMGHSIGHWEGDELVIDTTHFAPSTITNNGLDHSDEIHMVERYRLTDGGETLEASQWFEDPKTLENNGARYIKWDRGQDYVRPYECDPSFALEYQDLLAEEAD
jgi:hypothetical protein